MYRYAVLLFAVWSGALSGAAAAQERTTELDSLIQEALSGNPDLAAALARWQSAAQEPARVGSLADPSFMAQVIRLRDRGLGVRGEGETWYSLRQEVPFPGKLALRSHVAQRDAQRSGREYEILRLDLVEAVRLAYYRLLHAKLLSEVTLANRALVERTMEIARVRYEVGSGPQQELLLARVEGARIGNALADYRRMAETASAELDALLNHPVGSAIAITEEPEPALVGPAPGGPGARSTQPDPPSLDVDSLTSVALAQRPELAAARLVAARDTFALRLARKAFLPDLMVGLEYWTAQRDNPDPLPDERYVLDVGLTIPWLWRGKHEAGVRQARADVSASRYAFEQEVNVVRREVERAAAEVRSASDQLRSFQATILPEATLNLRSATEAYQTGETGFLTLLDSQRSLNELRIAYHASRVDLLMAWARLARATGDSPDGTSASQSPPPLEPARLPGSDTSSTEGDKGP